MNKKPKGYKRIIFPNDLTGKLIESYISDKGEVIFLLHEGWEELQKQIANSSIHYIETVPCPYEFDKPEIVKELIRRFNQTKIKCEIDLDLSLLASPTLHEHQIKQVKNSSNPIPETNPTIIDTAESLCGIGLHLKSKAKIKILNKESIENLFEEDLERFEKINSEANEKRLIKDETSIKQDLEEYQKNFTDLNQYIEKHLKKELRRVISRLIFEFYISNERGEKRENGINNVLELEDKAIRKRLSTAKGRVPIKERDNYLTEKENFIQQCLKQLKHIEARKNNLNRNQLAKMLFGDDNPLQSLRRRLKNLDLTFEEILQKYSEQKSS